MPVVCFDYLSPQTNPNQMEGLILNSSVAIDLQSASVVGKFIPTVYDGVNPHGTPIPGATQDYNIPLTIEDLTTIMETIVNRATALGMIPIPGTTTIEP